jgi:uncharacterized protein YbjT (DUF2867 family)
MFLVTGATGHPGAAVVRALLDLGADVRAVVRSPGDVALPPGVEEVPGDLDQPDVLDEVIRGVTAVFLLNGYEHLSAILKTMDMAGVQRVVLLSGSAASGGDLTNAIARSDIFAEEAVRDSWLPWTFLQPNTLMSTTFEWIPQLREGDVIRAPFADVPIATVAPDDVGAVAAKALTTDELDGRALRLTGPEALYAADRVRILGDVLGRDLRFVRQSNQAARAAMRRVMPEEHVDAHFDIFVNDAVDETSVLPTVREVLGREPHSFTRWAVEHRERFP